MRRYQHHRTLFCVRLRVSQDQAGAGNAPLVDQMLRCRIKFQSVRATQWNAKRILRARYEIDHPIRWCRRTGW
jgi:hypothetical protein